MSVPRWVIVTIAAAVVGVIVVAALDFGWSPGGSNRTPSRPSFVVANLTDRLGGAFDPGAPQAAGSNSTAVLVTGVGGRSPGDEPQPRLVALGGTAGTPPPDNLTGELGGIFRGGDTLGVAWNGSAWLVVGEAAWPGYAGAAAAVGAGDRWTNLTSEIAPYFEGQGAWIDGWNGSSWLIGGNDSGDAVLVSLHGTAVTDLTDRIPVNGPNRWFQFIAWNGTAWLVGGTGVFGALVGDRYVDLYPRSAFTAGGMFAADWNGSAWLVGGGSPARVEVLTGTQFSSAPALPPAFHWWVDGIVWDGAGWYIAGKGIAGAATFSPELYYLPADFSMGLEELTSLLPSAFDGGQVQFAGAFPMLGAGTVLLIGQGGVFDARSGQGGISHGALASVHRH